MLISGGLAMLILFGLLFYGLWKYQTDDVEFEHKHIDPDMPVAPLEEEPISQVIKERAEHIKETMPLTPNTAQVAPMQHGQSVDTIPAPRPQDAQTNVAPQQVYSAPDSLTERAEILDVENPIVEPSTQPLDVDIPDREVLSEAKHDSPYGVRYASDSPNRMLRDKRYRRNSS